MNIESFKHEDWGVYWSGDKWSPLGFSSWGLLCSRKPLSENLDFFIKQSIIVWDGETTTCYIRNSENKIFGQKLVALVVEDSSYLDYVCNNFVAGTDLVLSIYRKNQTEFTFTEYESYNKSFLDKYYVYHIQNKNVVDYLSPDLLKKYLPKLQQARVYAEPVFSERDRFYEKNG